MNGDINKGCNHRARPKYDNQYWDDYMEDDMDQFLEPYEEIQRHLREEYGYDKEHARKEVNYFNRDCGWDDEY